MGVLFATGASSSREHRVEDPRFSRPGEGVPELTILAVTCHSVLGRVQTCNPLWSDLSHMTRIHHAEPLPHPLTTGATGEGYMQGIRRGVLEQELKGIRESLQFEHGCQWQGGSLAE